jgi:hypothetical protein
MRDIASKEPKITSTSTPSLVSIEVRLKGKCKTKMSAILLQFNFFYAEYPIQILAEKNQIDGISLIGC